MNPMIFPVRITLPIPEEWQDFYGKEAIILHTVFEIPQHLLGLFCPGSQHKISLTFEKPELEVTGFKNTLNVVILFPITTIVKGCVQEQGLVAEQEGSHNRNGTFKIFMRALHMCDNVCVMSDNLKKVGPAAVSYNIGKRDKFASVS